MTVWNKQKSELAALVNDLLKESLVKADDFILPPDPSLGDLALPLFVVGKKLAKSPIAIADELAERFSEGAIQAMAAGPYVNFRFGNDFIARVLTEIGQNQKFGSLDLGKSREVMIEYSNVNTHKEYHLGHLRNICYGDAVNRLYEAVGYRTWPVSYVNDFGIHAAKTIWAIKRGFVAIGEDDSADKGCLLGRAYVEAVKQMEILPEAGAEVSAIMQNIEAQSGDDYDLWSQTRQWSLDYFESIYRELKIEFAERYYESEHISEGKALVDKLLAQGILKESQGAIIADLEEYGLGVLVVIRADGTSLYPVADLALASEKFKRHDLVKSFYVVDNRQSLYFRQLFKILELMGYSAEMAHLAYDFVKLPTGMISSRTGNTIAYRDLYLQIFDKFKSEILERHVDWEEDEVIDTASRLTVATLKFEMLKVGADKVITFDTEEALSFNGFTAAYLEYTVARINSVLRKAETPATADYALLASGQEKSLAVKLAQFPEQVGKAAESCNPSEIAKYLFDSAREFNDYYHSVPILVDDLSLRQARLILLANIKQVLSNGLDLLGIEIVDRM